jgi:hypothetical protein
LIAAGIPAADETMMSDAEEPACLDYLLSFCFYQRVCILHGRKVAIPEHHRSSRLARAMPPAFAENNWVTIQPFKIACSSTAHD